MIFEILAAITSGILNLINGTGYWGIFVGMAIESSFIPFPSEIILIPAGALAFQGKFSLVLLFLVSILASLVGAFVNYFLALCLGRPAVEFLVDKYGKFFLLNNEKLKKADIYFLKHGEITTFVGRLIPVVRQLISLPAGFAKMNLAKFAFYTALGSGIWSIFLLALGYSFGANYGFLLENLSILKYGVASLALLIFLFYFLFRKVSR